MKKLLILLAFTAVSLGSFAQSPFVTYEPTPTTTQSNPYNSQQVQTNRITGYVKDFSGVRKVSLQVAYRTDSYGNDIVTVVKLLELQTGISSKFSTYGGNKWKTVNARAQYCNGNCDFTFYASYNGGYIFFDN